MGWLDRVGVRWGGGKGVMGGVRWAWARVRWGRVMGWVRVG